MRITGFVLYRSKDAYTLYGNNKVEFHKKIERISYTFNMLLLERAADCSEHQLS